MGHTISEIINYSAKPQAIQRIIVGNQVEMIYFVFYLIMNEFRYNDK